MAGILDNKQRVMDTLVLLPGRFQASDGHMQFRYVTFTDRHAFYEGALAPTASNVANDAADRIYFEASQRFQDLICPETALNGFINFQYAPKPELPANEFSVHEGLFSKFSYSGSYPSGTIVNALVGGLPQDFVEGMTGSYEQQHFLATKNPYDRSQKFILNTGSLEFDFNDMVPPLPEYGGVIPRAINVKDLKPVWNDERFMHLPNYMYLPPVNRLPPGAKMERILPFIITGLDLPNTNWQETMEKLKAWKEGLGYYQSGYANTTSTGGIWDIPGGPINNLNVESGSPGLVNVGEGSDHPSVLLHSVPGLAGSGFNTFHFSWIMVAFANLDENDFAAARMAFMGLYPGDLQTKYTAVHYTLQHLMDSLAAKNTVTADGKYDYNAIIGDVITFPESSQDNNLVMQIYEFPMGENNINKLTIVDHGDLADENANGPNQRLFYAGKMYENDDGNLVYANTFTIVMHNSSFAAAKGDEWFGFKLANPDNKWSIPDWPTYTWQDVVGD